MSVNLLSVSPTRYSITDDLESLIMVLIYYAVRYLSSNIEANRHVATFLEQCFDSYTIGSRKVLCSERKMDIVKGGDLFYYLPGTGRASVVFDSPLDKLLGTILRWFSVHYKVVGWEAHIALHRSLARAQTEFHTPAKSSRPQNGDDLPSRRDGAPQALLRPVPTPEDRGLASRVSGHSFIISEFWHAIRSELWSVRASDRHPDPDRVPVGWLSKLQPVPYFTSEEAA